MRTDARTPLATWRAQFTPDWRFEHAAAIAPILQKLGISHLYASPIFEARAGSTHGYDVTDPTRIRKELGGRDGFLSLASTLRERGIGIILDIVPNHMAADHGNPWWWDALARGRDAHHAGFFDIDWDAADGRVILPVLGKSLDECLDAGEISIAKDSPHGSGPSIAYFDKRFPIAPDSRELLPTGGEASPRELRELLNRQHYTLAFWRDGLRAINYRRFFDIADLVSLRMEDRRVFDAWHSLTFALLDDGLIDGLRIDHIDGLYDPRQYLERLRERMPQGAGYLIVEKILAHDEHLPQDWPIDGTSGYEFLAAINPLFVDPDWEGGAGLIESDAQQRLDAAPAFEGAAREAKRFVIRELFQAETDRLIRSLTAVAEAAGESPAPEHLREALTETTAAMQVYRTYITHAPHAPGTPRNTTISAEDHRRITEALDTADAYAQGNNAPWRSAVTFLRRILLAQPAPLPEAAQPQARAFTRRWQQYTGPVIAKGVEDTALYRRITLASLSDVGCDPDTVPANPVDTFHEFCEARAARAPHSLNATATHDTKRGEDTRLRIHILSSFPSEYLSALDRWSAWHAPLRSELPAGPAPRPADEALIYQSLLGIWPADSGRAGDDLDEDIASRLTEYMIKAAREAKLRSSWHAPDEHYETSLRNFIHALIVSPEGRPFREDTRTLREHMMAAGAAHSLSQVALKCFAPGIPDIYRGTELWDLSLVDPDNRRPVDFAHRQRLFESIRARFEGAPTPEAHTALLADLMDDTGPLGWRTGAIKLFTMWRSLTFRRQHADLLTHGEYIRIKSSGVYARNLLACARRLPDGDRWALAILPRLIARLPGPFPRGEAWGDTAILLPEGAPSAWQTTFAPHASTISTVEGTCNPARLLVADVLREFPVALLSPAA